MFLPLNPLWLMSTNTWEAYRNKSWCVFPSQPAFRAHFSVARFCSIVIAVVGFVPLESIKVSLTRSSQHHIITVFDWFWILLLVHRHTSSKLVKSHAPVHDSQHHTSAASAAMTPARGEATVQKRSEALWVWGGGIRNNSYRYRCTTHRAVDSTMISSDMHKSDTNTLPYYEVSKGHLRRSYSPMLS